MSEKLPNASGFEKFLEGFGELTVEGPTRTREQEIYRTYLSGKSLGRYTITYSVGEICMQRFDFESGHGIVELPEEGGLLYYPFPLEGIPLADMRYGRFDGFKETIPFPHKTEDPQL